MSKGTGCHENADQHQQAAAYDVDYLVISLDPVEDGFEIVDEHGAQDERNAQSQRIGQQHQHALERMSLLGGQHERGTEKRANAGSPAQGEDYAEYQCGEEVHVFFNYILSASPEQVDMEHYKEIQTEEDDDQARTIFTAV